MSSRKIFKRLSSKLIETALKEVGGVILKGARSVGKTTVALQYANKSFNLSKNLDLFVARNEPDTIFKEKNIPILIDEWQIYPNIITIAKTFIDFENRDKLMNGLVILTGSVWLGFRKIIDPGIGRFAVVKVSPLSLYESNDSEELISLFDLVQNSKFKPQIIKNPFFLDDLLFIICRGGFPQAVDTKNINFNNHYIEGLFSFLKPLEVIDFREDLMLNIIQRLAQVSSQISNLNKLLGLVQQNYPKFSRQTLEKYIDALHSLFLIDFLPSYSTNISSNERIMRTEKWYFCDPALAIACNGYTMELLKQNLNTFGFYFENLVYRDLKNYADFFKAHLFYYRDFNGNEVDFIMEFPNGKTAAIEVKLGSEQGVIDAAAKNLIKYKKFCQSEKEKQAKNSWNIQRNWVPDKLIVITGVGQIIEKQIISGEEIYIIPICALKP